MKLEIGEDERGHMLRNVQAFGSWELPLTDSQQKNKELYSTTTDQELNSAVPVNESRSSFLPRISR